MSGWRRDVRAGVMALLLMAVWASAWASAAVCVGSAGKAAAAAAAVSVPDGPYVALTFDDGPRASTTTVLLDGLSQRGVHATFFVLGLRVDEDQEVLKRMADEGHQIGLHTNNHKMLINLSPADVYREVNDLRETLTELLGDRDFMVRPPYGKVNAAVRAQVGAPIILWSIDPEDWSDHDTARQTAEIVEKARDGDIILLHDVYASSVETALKVVDELMARGFYFVTVEELFALRGIEPEDGQVYYCLPPSDS